MGPSGFEIPPKVIRLKVEVENMEGPICKPHTYVKHRLLFGDHKIQ
jgi:hypothetical protein